MKSEPSESLRQFIREHHAPLLATIRLYAARAGLDSPDQAAAELLSEVTAAALAHAQRFADVRQPMHWLLGIAANCIKRRQTRIAKQERREPLIRDLHQAVEEQLSDGELFDLIASYAGHGSTLESDEWIDSLLANLNADERQIVQLAVLHDLNGAMLAQELGISPGAARTRLYRALKKLRAIYQEKP